MDVGLTTRAHVQTWSGSLGRDRGSVTVGPATDNFDDLYKLVNSYTKA
jgi:hypothetical protein